MTVCKKLDCNNTVGSDSFFRNYCSMSCYQHNYNKEKTRLKKEERERKRQKQECINPDCDKVFIPNGTQTYCTVKCRQIFYSKRPKRPTQRIVEKETLLDFFKRVPKGHRYTKLFEKANYRKIEKAMKLVIKTW